MGYQDFLQNYKQKRQQEPIELPEYEPLPTQIEPVDQIFGKPRPADKTIQAETNTSAPLEKPKKKKDILDTKLSKNVPFETLRDVKDWTPNRPIQDLKQLGSALKVRRQLHQPQQPQKKRTVAAKPAAKTTPHTSQTGKDSDQSEFLNQMNFRGPSEVQKMAERAIAYGGQQHVEPRKGKNLSADFRSWVKEDLARQQKETAQSQAMLEGIDTGKTKLDPTAVRQAGERQKRIDELKRWGTMIPGTKTIGRGIGRLAGMSDEEIAQALPSDGFLEDAVSHAANSAIRSAAGIPEGITRFLEQNLINRDAVQTYELMNQFADAEDVRAKKEGRPSRADEYRKIAQGSLESQTHFGDVFEPLTKAGETLANRYLPTDPTVQGSINPLKEGFWRNTLPEAAGSMVPFFVGGAAGAAVKIPRMVSAGVLGAGMEIPQAYHEARDAGATPEQLSRTIDTRTAAGALEMFGAESLLGKIGMKGKSIPGYLAKESFQEGVQEAGQSLTSDIGDKYYAGTKPNLAWSQIGHNALENAVPALFLGLGGGAMGVPAHLAERKANSAEVAQQIESLANAEPSHPVVQAIASLGIDPQTITQADERAVDELSIRLQSMAKMDSQIQQMQGQREVLAQQAQNVYDAQLMGRVPSSADMQAAQQLPMVDQAVAELTQQKETVAEDLTQNVSPLFKNLAKAVGSKQVEPLADVADDQQGDLLKEVRKAGGIVATEGQVEAGELEGLSPKESGTTGLISRSAKRGESPDRMRERMASEGLTTAETANQFIDEVKAETRRQKTEAESYAGYQRSQMTEQEQADSDLLDQHLADRATTFSRVWRTLDNPKTIFTPNLARDFVREAEKAGFSDEFIERSLVEFEAQRGVRRQGSESEESRGLRTDSSIDTGVPQSSMVDSERSINLSRRSAEPGIGVSMSPYKVLEANNKDLLKRLYDVNLNSEEGKAGIAQLRDYARENDIEQRHVNAHISDIQNWQKTYGVPKNLDIQQPQATRTTGKSEKEAISQPARTEAAPVSTPSGFSQEQKRLLGRESSEVADDEFDEHLEAVEKLHADAVRGKVNLNEGQMGAVVKKIRQIKGERHQRVRAGRLKSLYGKKEGKQPTKTALAEEAKKAVGKERETKESWQMTRDEYRDSLPETERHGGNSVIDQMISSRAGETPAKMVEFYAKKYSIKKPIDIVEIPKYQSVTKGTKASLRANVSYVEDKGNRYVLNLVQGSTPTVIRHEIEHVLDVDREYWREFESKSEFKKAVETSGERHFQNYRDSRSFAADYSHRSLVKRALKKGENVPSEVLADYPDLNRETESVPRETENVPQAKQQIDEAAHEAATSPKNELAEPTEAQKEAGNYQKGHIKLHGLDITIENPEGSTRSGKDADGKPWEVEMSAHYGYIRRTEGADEEQIDVYIGPKTDSNEVFVVDQVDAETGEFDEHKVILGAETQAEAEKLYDAHFDDGKGPDRRGAITQMPIEEFKDWLKSEDTALPVSESLGEVDDIGKTEPSGEKAEKDGDAEVGQSPDGGLQVGSGGDVLQPIRQKNSVQRIMGDIHSLEDVQRVGEVDFELWENEGKGGKTTIIRDAETGEPIGTRYDPDGERATKRHQNDVQTARKREVSSDERSVDDGRLPESGLADKPGTGKPVTAKSEGKPERESKSGSVVGKPAKSGKRRGLGKQATPSLFGDEAEQTTESSNSEHAQELVAEVAQETEPIAAGEAVIQAAVADLPEVAEEVQSEEPQPKPVKTPKPKSQPLATLTSASFTITPDIVDQIRSGGAVTKYKQNVDAIKTMRQVLLEGRRPTVEEQETMALYAGFGGIKDLFAATGNTYEDRKKWFDRQQELKELIGEEAYKAASASTKNAHYTDPHIVTAMWSMAERLGFTKGRVLEPSMGSGNFLGLIPSHLRDKATFTGVELDNTTGNIAKMLYPDANIHIQGFEDLKAPDGFFDLAIGNVPFGDYRISDNRYNKLLPQIHNYFFLKALDKVRPGGLVMFITSTGTMDSRRGEDIRKELAKQADLVSAMRFPAETFGKTALTSVVTDLIILRKRLPGEISKSDAWVKSSEVNDPRGAGYQKIKLNDYFAENPSQILGEFNGNNRMYPGRANVDRTEDFEQRLAEAMANLPAGVMSEYSSVRQPRMKEAGMKAKEGGYIVKDGQLLQGVSGGLAEIDATPDRVKRVDGMLKIRDAFDNLIDAEMGRAVGGPAQRKALNSAYDAFHAKYGPISDKKNREALEGDPDLYRLMALEDYDAKKKIAKKQPIFTKSTVSGIRADAKPSNVVEAVAKSFQMNGEIILSQLAEDLGLDERTIGEELVAKKIAFQTPNANWELAPHYLSGNVRRKLAEAKIAAATDDFYQANVDALEQLLPRDIRSDEISVEMGAPWVEPQVISQFVAELFEDDPGNVGVSYDRHLGAFTLSLDRSRARGSRLATTTWGTADLPFDKLLNLALTGKQASVFDEVRTNNGTERRFNAEKTQAANTKLDAIKQRFREWVWENDERKQKLLSKYNDLFNSHVPAEYNVEFLLDEKGEGVVPGLSSGWKLRKHQAAAVFRAVIEKRGLLAHEVGLGKTLAMIASASELKRLGIARKPAIAVPKKVLPGFVQAARMAFPLLKVHVIDSRDAAKRNTSMSQVATGEHDLVLMTHDNMDMLKMKPEFEAEILRSELDEVTAVYNAMRGEKTSDKRLLKQIENRKAKLEAKLQDALKAERKDDTISFEDTGIDFLFVDEFHKYKSLPVVTALGQVKGVPTGDSQRAINMLMRARYLQQIQNGGGLIAATGTPVSNSLVEAWIMAKFLQPDLLEEAGVQSFDAWTRQFAETVPALEMGATGEWKQVSRLSKFKNLPELQTLARMTLDVKTAKETGILDVRPKRQDKVIQVPQDEAQAAFMQVLRERAAAVKAKLVEPYEDNYLVISSDGMQMASDPRLVLPGYKAEGGKIKALAGNVLRIYKEKPGTTQMIFSDSGVAPNAWGFHLYGEIINKLIEGGIPADKIINFSKMDTDAKVAKAQDRLNSGDAVIAIGHRENMGTGINAQQKMAAIHQFDVPWKPALVEQSEARGWRQGNENKEIEILSYVTEGSFDAIKWSTVARKQQAITAFMQKPQEGQARELEDADDDALSYDQIAAAASGDGDYLRKAELDAKVFKLDMMERSHNSEALNRKQEIPRIVDRIAALNRRATQMDLVATSAKEVKEKEFEYKTPKGEVVEDKKDAAKNLVSNYLFEKDRKERSVIGQYKGYRLMSDGYGSAYMELPIKGAEAEKVGFNVNTTEFIGTLQSLEKKVSALASNADADHLREVAIPNLEKDLENLRAVTDSPFPFTEQLTKAKRQLEAVNKRLKAKEAESASEGQPLSAGETDVRAVSALGREIRRHLREKEIKPSDIPRILEEALPAIEAQLRDQKDVWREFQRRKAEDFLAEHEGDTGLAGMAITAQSASRAQAAYDPDLDAAESRPMASRRTRESVESSPEFKKWFGQSKVVNQSGKPLPLYHGTQARNEIEAIDPSRFLSGSHFGPGFYMAEEPEIASRGYAEGHLHPRGQEQSGSPSVYKLYARIENPLDMSRPADSKMIVAVFGNPNVDLEEMGFGSRPTNEVLYKQLAKRLGDDKRAANEKLQELGFDGITRLNRASDESPEHREWVVFDPRQVKSATGNQGTFDDSANLSTSRREVSGPASELANPMDVLLHAETITKSRGSRGIRMYVNDHARALLGASLTEVFGEDYSNVNAINLSREEVSKVADYLEGEAKGLSGDYQAGATQFVQELRDMLAQGGGKQKTFNIVDITPFEQRYSTGFRPDAERAVETFKGDVREESFHWSQREVGGTAIASVGSSWAQSSKGYGKYRKALLKLGYPDDPEVIAAETAAKIAAGKFEDLGIRTEADHQQADEWLASYFERIADKHGVDALTKFDRLLPKATEAKQKGELSAKERLRQAIKEEAATATGQRTDRLKPSGGSGQTVRSGNQEKREEGRAEPIPRRSAEEPFNSAPSEDLSQASLFDEKGMPRKEWGDIWKTLADILNIPKALRASGDLSAGGRQGWFLSIPPTRWHIAAKSFGKSLQASEAFGLKKGADKRLHAEMKQRSAYRDAVAAGLAVHSNDPLSVQTELFGSRLAGEIPWAKYSEQAYKTHLDWLSLMTFEVYKKSIDKQIKDPKERFEAYQAAADWINVSSGRGSYRGKFGAWYQRKAAPMLNIFGWAPGLVYSRFQLLNPYTYAQNLKNPGHRVVFRKQMSEVFQSAGVLYLTAVLAKAGGALVSTDPDDADFLKLRFGTTRYDVLAGLQQVARLSLRIGDYLRTKATTDTSTEEGQKKVRKASGEATTALLRFGRTKLGPVPGFVVDWWNDWVKVTGERHAPGDFITSFKEGNKVKGVADLAEDPIVSQVLPLFWADMVAAYEQGWRANGNAGGLEHVAKVLPAGFGIGVQDYDRPEWKKETRKQLDKFDLDPQFPKRKTGEKEEAYQKRVKEHIADQEAAINRFSSSESVRDQPLARQKELLKQEMSEDGRNRLEKLRPDDIEDDRAVRAWILLGRERLKNDERYKSADEETQKKILQSYYSRMNPYKAQPGNKVHGYQKPDFVDEDVLKRKIGEAIKAQQ